MKNYYLLVCNPNEWFGKNNVNNAKVNDILFFDENKYIDYSIGKNKNAFKTIKKGDIALLKVGKDIRNIKNRTINNTIVDKLDAGIYLILEVIEKNGEIKFIDNDGIEKVHYKVKINLTNDNILNKNDSEKLLKNYYKSYFSTKIEDNNIINEIIDIFDL
jgi:hypothetical protein